MRQAENGDTVSVHYTGRLDDGTAFDSSSGREPLQFSLGSHQVIKGFEDAQTGMSMGEKKTVRIPAAEAYGPRDEALVLTVQRSQMPQNINLAPGLHLQSRQKDGSIINFLVTGLTEETVTLDANHPMSGKDLTFDLELVGIGEGEAT